LRSLRQYRVVLLFLLAYWLYIDGVGTVIRMAVAYGRALGFEQAHLILALLLVQFVGFPAAIAFGYLGERIGPRRGITLGLAVYVLVCIWGALIRSPWEFFAIAVLIGLVQGGVQALSRSCYARLIPTEKSGEFFGFYNLMGKFAALIGPPLFGLFGIWFGDARYSMLSLILLFVAGGVLLWRVPAAAFADHGRDSK
jgi:UMF1 family MFS transporter